MTGCLVVYKLYVESLREREREREGEREREREKQSMSHIEYMNMHIMKAQNNMIIISSPYQSTIPLTSFNSPWDTKQISTLRVVDLALNQSQTLETNCRYHLWLCFRKCIGDKSATLTRNLATTFSKAAPHVPTMAPADATSTGAGLSLVHRSACSRVPFSFNAGDWEVLQGGPRADRYEWVKCITPISRVMFTPVAHVFSATYRG